mgnify:FL=1
MPSGRYELSSLGLGIHYLWNICLSARNTCGVNYGVCRTNINWGITEVEIANIRAKQRNYSEGFHFAYIAIAENMLGTKKVYAIHINKKQILTLDT